MKLTKERIAYLRESVSNGLLLRAVDDLLEHTDAMLEAEAPKPCGPCLDGECAVHSKSTPDRCGGKPGEPNVHWDTSEWRHWWHPKGTSRYPDLGWHHCGPVHDADACTECPGCPDCQPKADWALEAAREWLHYPEGNAVAGDLAAIIRKHAPKGV